MKICKRYLHHMQNSVFEGHITGAKLVELKERLREKIDPAEDSIQIYRLPSIRAVEKDSLGKTPVVDTVIG